MGRPSPTPGFPRTAHAPQAPAPREPQQSGDGRGEAGAHRPSLTARRPALAFLPFAAMPLVLARLPGSASGPGTIPWWEAALRSAVLAGLVLAHALCYERWHPRSPRRILANELLARAWFVAYALLLVALRGPGGGWFLAMAAPWALLTWLVHRDQVRKEGYRWASGVAILGMFLLGLALLGLVTVQGP